MMQNTGGAITRAMNAHMSSVFECATFHSICAAEVCGGAISDSRVRETATNTIGNLV